MPRGAGFSWWRRRGGGGTSPESSQVRTSLGRRRAYLERLSMFPFTSQFSRCHAFLHRKGQGGFALIEVMVAGAILVIGALGFAASVSTGHALAVSVEERGLAAETLQRLIERLRAD